MITWASIYEHPSTDPVADRVVMERAGQRTLLVPVPAASDAVEVARLLVDEGVTLIELCGGFTLHDASRVMEAVGDRVPVGHVTFAADAAPGVAAYAAAFQSQIEGEPNA
ncbi:DUF6506 family protein [Streptomyces sp. NPDC090445]|uniref:DUF6506 family protein n=1 Tax=Streptomyces sp. NPDC090445 TaxID=3365963 RepID=UPI003826264F